MFKLKDVLRVTRAKQLSVFCGNPDTGKSTTVAYVIATATTGRNWYGAENSAGPIDVLLAIGEETSSDEVIPRLIAAGADMDRVQILKDLVHVKTGKV